MLHDFVARNTSLEYIIKIMHLAIDYKTLFDVECFKLSN